MESWYLFLSRHNFRIDVMADNDGAYVRELLGKLDEALTDFDTADIPVLDIIDDQVMPGYMVRAIQAWSRSGPERSKVLKDVLGDLFERVRRSTHRFPNQHRLPEHLSTVAAFTRVYFNRQAELAGYRNFSTFLRDMRRQYGDGQNP